MVGLQLDYEAGSCCFDKRRISLHYEVHIQTWKKKITTMKLHTHLLLRLRSPPQLGAICPAHCLTTMNMQLRRCFPTLPPTLFLVYLSHHSSITLKAAINSSTRFCAFRARSISANVHLLFPILCIVLDLGEGLFRCPLVLCKPLF